MFAEVAIPNTTLDALTYAIPDNLINSVVPGSLVKIKLKNQETFGLVVEINKKSNTRYTKDIISVIDARFINQELLSVLIWAKKYYFTSWGQVLNLSLPQSVYKYKLKPPEIKTEITYTARQSPLPDFPLIRKIIYTIKTSCYKTFLLYNANNKKSAEIYLRVIKETLRLHKSSIILVPEIFITGEFINLYKEHLGEHLFCLHSGLKLSERKKIWHTLKNRDYAVVLGTRIAIFAPVNNLGLVIVDTEHDSSYKEIERHFHYNARDIAVVRAQMSKAVAVLASATPSCETFYNTKIGKYELITAPHESAVRGQQSAVRLVDMRRSKSKIISPQLQYEIQSAYRKGKQIVLFLNRRGYARSIVCNDCGYIPHCPDCSIPFVLHSEGKFFVCNICKYREFAYDFCPQCKGNDFLYQGIGIQQVVQAIKEILPRADIVRIDSDVKQTTKQHKMSLRPDSGKQSPEIKNSIRNNPWSGKILITTKLGIRGIDYSRLGLFGIISADTGLFMPDFRAQEKTFEELSHIIAQCNTSKDCKVIIQTYHPDNHAIYLAVQENYPKFYQQEINSRKNLAYPPFSRIATISVASVKPEYALKIADKITAKIQPIKDIIVLGPSLAPPSKKPRTETYQLLVKMKPYQSLSNFISREDLIFDKAEIDINIDPL